MRGASAIERILQERSNQDISVFVVWEPVLPTDWMAPSTANLRRIPDGRAQQYWDKGRLLSKAMGEKDSSAINWDMVAVYPRGVTWTEEAPPHAIFADGVIVDVLPAFTAALEQAMGQAIASSGLPSFKVGGPYNGTCLLPPMLLLKSTSTAYSTN